MVQLLEDIQQEAAKVGAHFKIAVLTAYSGQKHIVEREIDQSRSLVVNKRRMQYRRCISR